MLPTAIKWKRTLMLMCALLVGMSLLLATHPQTAFAQTAGQVSVDRVYTADDSCSPKSTFAHGDAIHYEWVITNTSDQPMQVVIAVGVLSQNGELVTSKQFPKTVRPGQSHWHVTGGTIPTSIESGTYTAVVVVDYNGDGQAEAGGKSTFTVTSGI